MAPLAEMLAANNNASAPLEPGIDFAHVADAVAAQSALLADLQPGDAILIKGSNAVGLSRIVTALTGGDT
jgi:UDP-N-acetylmuramoyl-tripeptide--D-alanyl-D-alanine ligase